MLFLVLLPRVSGIQRWPAWAIDIVAPGWSLDCPACEGSYLAGTMRECDYYDHGGRHCYSATLPFLVILCCGDMDLLTARGRPELILSRQPQNRR